MTVGRRRRRHDRAYVAREMKSLHAGRPISRPLYGLDEPAPEWNWPQQLAAAVLKQAIADLDHPDWSRQALYFLRSDMMWFWCDVARLPRTFTHARGQR